MGLQHLGVTVKKNFEAARFEAAGLTPLLLKPGRARCLAQGRTAGGIKKMELNLLHFIVQQTL